MESWTGEKELDSCQESTNIAYNNVTIWKDFIRVILSTADDHYYRIYLTQPNPQTRADSKSKTCSQL